MNIGEPINHLYPLGWRPQSGITWNGGWLPYTLRITDMLPCGDIPMGGEEGDYCLVDIDTEGVLFFKTEGAVLSFLRKGVFPHNQWGRCDFRLLHGRYFYCYRKDIPSANKISLLKKLQTIPYKGGTSKE